MIFIVFYEASGTRKKKNFLIQILRWEGDDGFTLAVSTLVRKKGV